MSVCLCIFFNDTATTEYYTYGHTLSLHDALPIYEDVPLLRAEIVVEVERPLLAPIAEDHGVIERRDLPQGTGQGGREARPVQFADGIRQGRMPRSEEHTYELQSLMRISYAVFCLKKKKKKMKITQH